MAIIQPEGFSTAVEMAALRCCYCYFYCFLDKYDLNIMEMVINQV